MIRSKLTAPALLLALLAAGCGEDPAAKVSQAKVEPAKPEVAAKPEPGQASGATAALPSEVPPKPAAPAGPVVAKAGGYAISPETSKIEFVGSKTLPPPGGKHDGGFKAFSGAVELVPGKPEVAKVEVVIDTTSIFSDDPKLTGHLKNKDFFEVETYPTAKFVTTAIRPGGDKGATHTLVGNLTLHGVTKSIEVPATVKVEGDAATIRSEFSLNRNDFGMTYGSPAVRELVIIKLDVKAVKKA